MQAGGHGAGRLCGEYGRNPAGTLPKAEADSFIIGTEQGIFYELQRQKSPEKIFILWETDRSAPE